MQVYTFKRIMMQANNLNHLLEAGNTPKPKIEFEILQLCQSIEDYRSSRKMVNDSEIEFVHDVLRKAQTVLINNEMEI